MLSTEYSAKISPDPVLRRVILVSGALLGVAGNLLIFSLPLASSAHLVGVALWSFATVREIQVLRRAWVKCIALKFVANGEIRILGPDLEWRPATLVSGSILLRSTGWLRLRTRTGDVFAEPVRAVRQQVRDWRRMQVIWRHVGA